MSLKQYIACTCNSIDTSTVNDGQLKVCTINTYHTSFIITERMTSMIEFHYIIAILWTVFNNTIIYIKQNGRYYVTVIFINISSRQNIPGAVFHYFIFISINTSHLPTHHSTAHLSPQNQNWQKLCYHFESSTNICKQGSVCL